VFLFSIVYDVVSRVVRIVKRKSNFDEQRLFGIQVPPQYCYRSTIH